ncbi:MAG TPA: hypothetical protein IAD04_06060 [Candidatus Caccosoma faecigallinarum]|uniref:Uncharacterized protein n=1 Tax=Candidatus Caccosoma faecigallinarum TaxID=2840720 RepID=A0A9D1GA72_9FIRM|nr:hypothetical protein [Candidatus Caccosoma faecigallinarum]
MKVIVTNEKYGEFVYEESVWTGKKELFLNGEKLEKNSKNVFFMSNGDAVYLKGNSLSGVHITINGETFILLVALKWYDILLSLLPFILVLIWGNSRYLVNIVPIIGGVIGGGLGGGIGGLFSGLGAAINVFLSRNIKNIWLKIALTILVTGLTFLICYLIALIIIGI